MTPFAEIAIIAVVGASFGLIAHLLRQPTIIGYLAAGLIIGPLGYIQVKNLDFASTLADIGIALLLFMVGLEMNPRFTRRDFENIGKPALWTGLGQVLFTFGIGYLILQAMHFSVLEASYISLALTFSSTIIVIQLLSQKKDLGSLYGKIVVGLLLIQDFIAIFALIFLSGLQKAGMNVTGMEVALQIGLSFLKGGVFLAIALFLSRKVFPKILNILGSSQEVLFMFSLAWGLGIAALMASPWIGFSIEIGGFLAGLALASSITHYQIASRIRPIRDFFIMMFFVILGAKFVIGNIASVILPGVLLSLFVLIGNPLIVMCIMALLGYRARTSFLASLTVAQISEFSLILVAMGLRLGHLNERDVSLVTLVGIVTIAGSSYFIMHGDYLYKIFKRVLKLLEFRKGRAEDVGEHEYYVNHTVLIGAHRMGSNIISALKAVEEPFLVVDFDPFIIETLKRREIPALYGDIDDEDIRELSGVTRARTVISTVPDAKDTESLLTYLKEMNPRCTIIVMAETEREARDFYKQGADYVILPHFIGGLQIAQAIHEDREFNHLERLKKHDLMILTAEAKN
jgi:Kef-type K+ transport system membrane component KefB